jgi:hypothetical protein
MGALRANLCRRRHPVRTCSTQPLRSNMEAVASLDRSVDGLRQRSIEAGIGGDAPTQERGDAAARLEVILAGIHYVFPYPAPRT